MSVSKFVQRYFLKTFFFSLSKRAEYVRYHSSADISLSVDHERSPGVVLSVTSVRDIVLIPAHGHSGQLSASLSGTVSTFQHMTTVSASLSGTVSSFQHMTTVSAILSRTASCILHMATVASCQPFCQGQCPHFCTWPQWCSCLPVCQGQCP